MNSEKMARKARKRARRGAKWLDKVYPDWRDHVDPDTLDMSDGQCCIFGQMLNGDGPVEFIGPRWVPQRSDGWLAARTIIFGDDRHAPEVNQFQERHGLVVTDKMNQAEMTTEYYNELTNAWREVLAED